MDEYNVSVPTVQIEYRGLTVRTEAVVGSAGIPTAGNFAPKLIKVGLLVGGLVVGWDCGIRCVVQNLHRQLDQHRRAFCNSLAVAAIGGAQTGCTVLVMLLDNNTHMYAFNTHDDLLVQAALGLNKGSTKELTVLDNLHGVLKPVSVTGE